MAVKINSCYDIVSIKSIVLSDTEEKLDTNNAYQRIREIYQYNNVNNMARYSVLERAIQVLLHTSFPYMLNNVVN